MDIDNNKLMGLLTIAGGTLLLSQEHIKEMRKKRKWVHFRIRKSKGAYNSIINISAWWIKKILESTFE